MNNPHDVVGSNIKGSRVIEYMVEVELKEDCETMFLRVRETLERIGIASTKHDKTLIQCCHILHKAGRYFITHYKNLYILDGKENRLTPHEVDRQSKIIKLLQDWNMITVIHPEQIAIKEPSNLGDIKILKFDERETWTTEVKYTIGSGFHRPAECSACVA